MAPRGEFEDKFSNKQSPHASNLKCVAMYVIVHVLGHGLKLKWVGMQIAVYACICVRMHISVDATTGI